MKKNQKVKMVAGYCRVSTPIQAEEGESLELQKKEIKKYVKSKGWKLFHIYEDAGISGFRTESRPSFQKMIKDANEGAFQGIIFSKLSRFARNASQFLKYRDHLGQLGIQLFSIKENIDPTTNTGKLMQGLLALIAEWDRENIREQMAESKLLKWSQGRTFIGKPPFGYVWNEKSKKLETNEKEKEIYQRIVDMYLNDNLSMKSISIKLREQRILCKKKPFSSSTISYILKNSAYYGNYKVNCHKYEYNNISNRWNRTEKLKPESEHILFEIPPIITKKKWDQIQAKTKLNKVRSKRGSNISKPYWLRDLLICGHCGGAIKPHHGSKRKDGSFPRYYSCYWSTASPQTLTLHNREKKCCQPTLPAEPLEETIWMSIIMHLNGDRLKNISSLNEGETIEDRKDNLKNQLKEIEKRISKTKKVRNRLFSLYEDEEIEKGELKKRLTKNNDQLLDLEGHKEEIVQNLDKLMEYQKFEQLRQEIRSQQKELNDLLNDIYWIITPDDRKRLAESLVEGKMQLKAIVENGIVKPDQLRYRFKYNINIFKQLFEEGKIGKSNPDGPDHPAAFYV